MLASAIASSEAASISATQSSTQPICSVAEAALVVGGDGNLGEDALDLLAGEAVVGSRSPARAATSSWAHGQAVIPVADTPTTRRVPCSKATARPCRV